MIHIDPEKSLVTVEDERGTRSYPMDSREAFEVVSDAWLRVGWDNKYVYSFTWLGRPLIQMPEDVLRIQEVIHEVGPDVIVETGVAHGGSLMFYASLCKALDRGRVVGIDVEIRPHNRKAIEEHNLSSLMTLIEGSSIDSEVVDQVRAEIGDGEVVVVILDSRHTREHVLAELEAYAPMVTRGSYVVVEDGCMAQVAGAPRSDPDWSWNNPLEAIRDFLSRHPEFSCDEPPFRFNEGNVEKRVTYWPQGYLRRV